MFNGTNLLLFYSCLLFAGEKSCVNEYSKPLVKGYHLNLLRLIPEQLFYGWVPNITT